MHIFQSEQVTQLRNVLDLLEKNEWLPNSPDLKQMDYHMWATMLGCYQKYRLKPPNIAELKTAWLSIWNSLPQEFIGKAIPSFRKS